MAFPGSLHPPVALTPRWSEQARAVEHQRALVAEAAMRAGPAITRQHILFEDEWLLLVNKPSGIYSGHVLASAPSVIDSAECTHLHLANRLDRDTSGVLIISKNQEVSGKLGQLFTKRKVAKSYIGLCCGCLPDWKAVTVTSGHGRSEFGTYNVFSVSDIGRKLLGRGGSVVKEMKTRFSLSTIAIEPGNPERDISLSTQESAQEVAVRQTVLANQDQEESPSEQGDDSTESQMLVCGPKGPPSLHELSASPVRTFLVTAVPLTGRTHQIRLQCLYLGIPLLGDVKYGGPHCCEGIRYNEHCLHAGSLSFKHPVTYANVDVTAPLPRWADHALQE